MSEGRFIGFAHCALCERGFTFDPDLVPSVLIDPETRRPPDVDADGNPQELDHEAWSRSMREPLCEECVDKVNIRRVERGYVPFPVMPGAYG